MAYEYVRTDKNGTKIYHDYTCDRCDGKGIYYIGILNGELEPSHLDSGICWKCHGTGKMEHPHVYKEYTPEYEAKLQAQREKRQAKRQAEEEAKRQEFMAKLETRLPEMLADNNFNADGKQYAVTGNTYSIKEELKQAGAKWNSTLNAWVFAEKPAQYDVVEIDWQEYMFISEYRKNLDVLIDYRNGTKSGKELVASKMPKVEQVATKPSEYVGTVGTRIEVAVTLTKAISYTVVVPSYFGGRDNTEIRFIYKFADKDGNVVVWKTGSGKMLDYEGKELTIAGSIKTHNEYKGEKQTVLQRVKVVK